MQALIYCPTKTSMQSGKARTKQWVLEFVSDNTKNINSLMGWVSSKDMMQEVILCFDSEEKAVTYAKENAIFYQVISPNTPKLHKKSYADNFVKKVF